MDTKVFELEEKIREFKELEKEEQAFLQEQQSLFSNVESSPYKGNVSLDQDSILASNEQSMNMNYSQV